jgi:hypothetical protein
MLSVPAQQAITTLKYKIFMFVGIAFAALIISYFVVNPILKNMGVSRKVRMVILELVYVVLLGLGFWMVMKVG